MQFPNFPGWPGPINPRGRGAGGVAYPALPALPGRAQAPAHPTRQLAGPAAALGLSPGQSLAPGQQAVPDGSPLSGLAAHGVPVGYTPGGNPMVQAGMANQGFQLPPNLPGMPNMPGPPRGLFDGGMGAGGLFQPSAPVLPFNSANQVQQLKGQRYQK